MPAFETPEAIAVNLEIVVGDVQIVAGEGTDTVVEVHPSHPAKAADVSTAEQTRVEYSEGRLLIKAPKTRVTNWRQYLGKSRPSIDVQIELPSGSNLEGEVGMADLRCIGHLGECRLRTGMGDIQIDQARDVRLRSGGGNITVHRTVGDAAIITGLGAVRIDSIDGKAVVKNGNGDTWIGAVTGDLHVNAANGDISVEAAQATVAAKTANGNVRVSGMAGGEVVAETACGKIELGVMDGVAAWLDLTTGWGKVQSDLDAAEHPPPGQDTVEVRARTGYGDITVRRCFVRDAQGGAA